MYVYVFCACTYIVYLYNVQYMMVSVFLGSLLWMCSSSLFHSPWALCSVVRCVVACEVSGGFLKDIPN